MPDRDTDGRLAERAGNGDQTAFLEIYERHRLPVFRFAYRLLGSADLAEDVTHDCFLSLIRKPENFVASRGSLRTYLFAAARNLAMKQFRTVGRVTSLDDLDEDQDPMVPVRQEPLHQLLETELSDKVREAVQSLPPLQREALILFEYEGLALNEIAAVVGADVGTVKSRLYRARERLRNSLHQYLNSNQEIVTLKEA